MQLHFTIGEKVILDTSGDYLKYGLEAQPTMIKPNRDEIEALYNIKLGGTDDVIVYAKKMAEEGIPYVVVSLGGDGSLLVCEEGIYQTRPPKVDVVNTVGCGDSMVGGFAVALEQNKTPGEALRYAAAVATANAMSPNTGDFDPENMKKIYEQTVVTKIA